MDKPALRREMLRLRAAIPPEERARRSASAADRMLALPALASPRSVMIFWSFGSEIRTHDLIDRLHAMGGRVLLPFLRDGTMAAAEILPGHSLVPSGYGPKEPAPALAADPQSIDVVVTPGLAFDRRGHRLGYGGAHYDRFRLLASRALWVGLGFHQQVVDRVPTGPGDHPMDIVVTDAETIECHPAG